MGDLAVSHGLWTGTHMDVAPRIVEPDSAVVGALLIDAVGIGLLPDCHARVRSSVARRYGYNPLAGARGSRPRPPSGRRWSWWRRPISGGTAKGRIFDFALCQ